MPNGKDPLAPMTLTALKQYQRLECSGLWQDQPGAQRRDVVVSFGSASLVLKDPRSDDALSHWSLPAIIRDNPGHMPALYRPGPDSAEGLELSDTDMVTALDTVRRAIEAARPRPGRLRGAIYLMAGMGLGGAAIGWLPDAVRTRTADMVPASARAEIGLMAFDDITRLTGAPCTEPTAQAALAALSTRLFGATNPPILLVMRDGLAEARPLPGDIILLPQALIRDETGPQPLAMAMLTAAGQAATADPLLPILVHGGFRATFTLLTTGTLPETAITGYGEVYLGGGTQTAVSASPLPDPLMPDADWIALQGICDL
jgi:hypothetical protein